MIFRKLIRAFTGFVRVIEVGPRDGLQNEGIILSPSVRASFISKLAQSGHKNIEAGSFVSPSWVPQMEGTGDVLRLLREEYSIAPDVRLPILIPNMKGMEEALKGAGTGAGNHYFPKEISVFIAASEAFNRANINCSIKEGLERIEKIIQKAKENNIMVRGYISTVITCPFGAKGEIVDPNLVLELTKRLLDLGCYEVSLGDTTGMGNAGTVDKLLKIVTDSVPPSKLALHFHDTYGQALANVLVGLRYGIRAVDSSVAGLGGCPYSPGAQGNLATEDLLYMLHGLGFKTGIDLDSTIKVGNWISSLLKRENASKIGRARNKFL